MLIDSHCHLHDREFFSTEQAEEMLKRAKYQTVEKIICIGTDPIDSMNARDFAKNHQDVYWTFGVHPNEWKKWNQTSQYDLTGAVAIGEVGLDYHYGQDDREQQIKLFRDMLDLAREHNLPVSFHIREAFSDFFEIIKDYPDIKGVVHSFSDNKKSLRKILEETNLYIGVNGMATYSTLPTPPLERIVLETDAPFLTPSPFRGIINEPGYVLSIAQWLAEKLSQNYEIIEKETTKNARQLFNI